jgi:hypothetical protein
VPIPIPQEFVRRQVTHYSPATLCACLLAFKYLHRANSSIRVPEQLVALQDTVCSAMRASGNEEVKAQSYDLAAWIYSSALLVAPEGEDDTAAKQQRAVLYGNRAECFLRLVCVSDRRNCC